MCKHVVLVPVTPTDEAIQKKACEPAMFGRVWHATRRAVSLHHPAPHQFACSQWQTTPHQPFIYLVYRWLLFISLTGIGVASFVLQTIPEQYHGTPPQTVNYFKWFIYLTNWGFFFIVVQSGLALALAIRYRKSRSIHFPCVDEEQPQRVRTPMVVRAYWLLHNVATDLAFVITLVYWTLVYDPKIHSVNAINILVHGANSIVVLLELLVTSHPFRFAHALYSVCTGLFYGAFTWVYWVCGGTDRAGLSTIYPPMDWTSPGKAILFAVSCASVSICAHALATCLTLLRSRLARRHFRAPSLPVCQRLTPAT